MILTLKIEDVIAAKLTEFRDTYFPRERNFLAAHITLFHNLPDELRESWQKDLEEIANNTSRFELKLTSVYPLGRGFAVRVESPELLRVRQALAGKWAEFLIPQDRQKFNPHCTIQNKVEPAQAREDMLRFQQTWEPSATIARGLQLWKYLNGPWRADREYVFAP